MEARGASRLEADTALGAVEQRLRAVADGAPPGLGAVVAAALFPAGKRLRPRVALLAFTAAGGTGARGVDAAVAVELLHAATLLVDDVFDDAATRRGRPAPWQVFGERRALLASGHLVAEAGRHGAPSRFDVERFGADALDDSVAALAAFQDVVAAETRALDGGPASVPDWVDVARGKTATLFQLAAEGGCRKAGAAALVPAFRAYGTHLGLAFQAADDVLDAEGDAATVGKPVRADARNLVTLLGSAAAARVFATQHADLAVEALAPVPDGAAKRDLVAVARAAVMREA